MLRIAAKLPKLNTVIDSKICDDLYTRRAFRNNRMETFETFDFADINTTQGQRFVSTVATQSLYFLNSSFVHDRSQESARRCLERNLPVDSALRTAYLECLCRVPSYEENEACLKVLSSVPHDRESQQKAWSIIYQSIFGSIDFRYLK